MKAICMNCENAFVKTGPYFTCAKCHGPCDTFRYENYTMDETYFDATYIQQKDENVFDDGRESNYHDIPFRRRVPKPKLSESKTLKKSQTTDQFRVFGYRIFNVCSRYADPFTWLDMIRGSKSKYEDKKRRKKSSTERTEESPRSEYQDGESSQQPL